MNINLYFVRESDSGLARLYRSKAGAEVWIPRSQITRCLKHPPMDKDLPVHELWIEDWWANKKMGQFK